MEGLLIFGRIPMKQARLLLVPCHCLTRMRPWCNVSEVSEVIPNMQGEGPLLTGHRTTHIWNWPGMFVRVLNSLQGARRMR